MIITEFIDIKINKRNINKYPSSKIGDIIKISISELSFSPKNLKIMVKCDYCFIEYEISYDNHLKSTKLLNKHSCSECKYLKIKEVNLIKYGVENPMQTDKVKSKVKDTNLQNYGVENVFQSNLIKDKIKETNLNKYGSEHIMYLDEFKTKIKETNLSKYGTESTFQSDIVKDKIKETNLAKYGVEYFNNYEKAKETNLSKYGFESYMSTDLFKIKSKDTLYEKHGVSHYSKTDEFKEKYKETSLERYGVDNIKKNDNFRKEHFMIDNHPNFIKYLKDEISLFTCDCGEHHNFEITSHSFHDRLRQNIPLCIVCYPISDNVSIKEQELFKFISSVYSGEIIQSYRNQLEIDIYLPELKIGFEFNGLYYHSDKYIDKSYHLNKTNYFQDIGIRIIHIWEDDWDYKKDIVKSMISNLLGNNNSKIYARNCVVKEIKNPKITNEFLNKNHIQGSVNSSLKLGIYHKDVLVSVMTFDHFEGRKRMSDNEWNLNRFCSIINTNVVGGASKLLDYFISNYKPMRIISYADKDWSNGNLYGTLSFEKINETKVDYKYVVNKKRIHKSRYKKSLTGISESNIDLLRVYDCGKIKYEKIL